MNSFPDSGSDAPADVELLRRVKTVLDGLPLPKTLTDTDGFSRRCRQLATARLTTKQSERMWTPVAELPLAARTGYGRTVLHKFRTCDVGAHPGQAIEVTLTATDREQFLDIYVTPVGGRMNRLAMVWVRFGEKPSRIIVGLCRNRDTGDDIGSINLTALTHADPPATVTGIDETSVLVQDGSAFGPEDAPELARMRDANLEERDIFDELLFRHNEVV